MSWSCPNEINPVRNTKELNKENKISNGVNGYCKRLSKPCQPGLKGCILQDKVKFLDLKKEEQNEIQSCD